MAELFSLLTLPVVQKLKTQPMIAATIIALRIKLRIKPPSCGKPVPHPKIKYK
jgi:hypothetical protein